MKILHVIPSVSPVRGGPSHAVLEMVWQLRHQGIDAAIATTNDDGDGLLDVKLQQWIDYPVDSTARASVSVSVGTSTPINTPIEKGDRTIPVCFFPRFSPALGAIREFTFSFALTRWLLQHMHEYDLIHIHAVFSYPAVIAMVLARLFNIPYIIRPLGSLAQWSLQQGAQKKQMYLRLIRRELDQTCALHFTSAQEQQEAAALALASPSFILPHGITLPPMIPDAQSQLRAWLGLPPTDRIILFLSRLHPKKGIETLIAALGHLSSEPFQLVIAGSGTPEYEAEITRCITSAGISARTHRVGFASGDRKQLLLQGADLFALPSHSENFGIAVLEAAGAGLPVLITPEVALAEWVQTHHVGWVVPQESEAIAQVLNAFIQDPTVGRAMGDRAAQVVRAQFAWPAIILQLIDHYQTLAHQTLAHQTLAHQTLTPPPRALPQPLSSSHPFDQPC
jgi:glycosyltransferase involved in cell wall biosynthesis